MTFSIRDSLGDYLQPEVAAEYKWQTLAACRGIWQSVDFFPARGVSADPAKKVCYRCPVRAKCLTDALERNEREGCWGATSEKERRPLLRRIAAGEPIEAVVALAMPRVRLGWKPSSQVSADYGRYLLTRRMTREAAA